MMGGRSGDIDPAAVLKLIDMGMTTAQVDKLLNKESGLYGVAGINSGDMRDLLAAADSGNPDAQLAINMFVRRIVKYIGAYFVLVGGVDAIVFTGGIGEFSEPTRRDVLNSLGALGVELDSAVNDACRGTVATISTPASKVKAIVMPTNEELMIARTVLTTVKL
jgi:acetate kinase